MLPQLADHPSHRYDLVKEQMQKPHAIRPVPDRMTMTLRTGHHVWSVGTTGIPKSGATHTADPPLPPWNNTGWADPPYGSAWTAQAAKFLQDHNWGLTQVYSTTGKNVARENLKLFMAGGWLGKPASPDPQTSSK